MRRSVSITATAEHAGATSSTQNGFVRSRITPRHEALQTRPAAAPASLR